MASVEHATACPNCRGNEFQEDKIVEIDASVVVSHDLSIPARAVRTRYQYTCIKCGHILDQPWTGHHDS